LEVLNHAGEWVSAPPLEGTFIVNIGQGFEVATGGRCPATTHRVLSPSNGKERYSVPFFQGIDLCVGGEDLRNLVKQARWEQTSWGASTVETPFATGKYKWGENQIRTKIRYKPNGVSALMLGVTRMSGKSFIRDCTKGMLFVMSNVYRMNVMTL
jgi:hypothetical protein